MYMVKRQRQLPLQTHAAKPSGPPLFLVATTPSNPSDTPESPMAQAKPSTPRTGLLSLCAPGCGQANR